MEMLTVWRKQEPEEPGEYLCWHRELGWSIVHLATEDAGHNLLSDLMIYGPLPEPPAGES